MNHTKSALFATVSLALAAAVVAAPSIAKANPCWGAVTEVLVRDSGNIEAKLSTTGSSVLYVAGSETDAAKDRLLTVLVAAVLSGKTVGVKIPSGSVCGAGNAEINYVSLQP